MNTRRRSVAHSTSLLLTLGLLRAADVASGQAPAPSQAVEADLAEARRLNDEVVRL